MAYAFDPNSPPLLKDFLNPYAVPDADLTKTIYHGEPMTGPARQNFTEGPIDHIDVTIWEVIDRSWKWVLVQAPFHYALDVPNQTLEYDLYCDPAEKAKFAAGTGGLRLDAGTGPDQSFLNPRLAQLMLFSQIEIQSWKTKEHQSKPINYIGKHTYAAWELHDIVSYTNKGLKRTMYSNATHDLHDDTWTLTGTAHSVLRYYQDSLAD